MRAFREAVEAGDLDAVEALLAEDVVFMSPVVFKPYPGKAITAAILRAVSQVFEDFRYERELAGADGRDHALVFAARVDDRELSGCDFIHVDDVVSCLIAAVQLDAFDSDTFTIAGRETITIEDLMRRVRRAFRGSPGPLAHLPLPLLRVAAHRLPRRRDLTATTAPGPTASARAAPDARARRDLAGVAAAPGTAR